MKWKELLKGSLKPTVGTYALSMVRSLSRAELVVTQTVGWHQPGERVGDLTRKDISSNFEEDQVTLLFNGDSVCDPNSGVTSLYIVCTIAEIIIKRMLNRNFN